MFKSDVQSVRLFRGYSYADCMSPLADCSVNDTLIKAVPFVDQSLFQMLDVTDPATVHALLQNAPDLVVNWIEIRAVRWPVLWPDEVWRLVSRP